MAKEEILKMNGSVSEVLPNAMFKVLLENEHTILATLSGRLRMNNIHVILGDKVDIEMSPYDLSRGRITYRGQRS